MAPKGGNAKKEGGRAKKAENEVSPFYRLKSNLPLSSDQAAPHRMNEREGGIKS
jgi:hypothetical protein